MDNRARAELAEALDDEIMARLDEGNIEEAQNALGRLQGIENDELGIVGSCKASAAVAVIEALLASERDEAAQDVLDTFREVAFASDKQALAAALLSLEQHTMLNGDLAGAEKALGLLLGLPPSEDVLFWQERGCHELFESYLETGEPDKAFALRETLDRTLAGDADRLLVSASKRGMLFFAYMDAGNTEKADIVLSELESLLADFAEDAEFPSALGIVISCLSFRGRFGEAKNHYRKLEDKDGVWLNRRAKVALDMLKDLIAAGKTEDALELYNTMPVRADTAPPAPIPLFSLNKQESEMRSSILEEDWPNTLKANAAYLLMKAFHASGDIPRAKALYASLPDLGDYGALREIKEEMRKLL